MTDSGSHVDYNDWWKWPTMAVCISKKTRNFTSIGNQTWSVWSAQTQFRQEKIILKLDHFVCLHWSLRNLMSHFDHYSFCHSIIVWIISLSKACLVIFQKRVGVFHRGFQTWENCWKHEPVGRVLLLFSSVWKPRCRVAHKCTPNSKRNSHFLNSLRILQLHSEF